ncbi:MAG: hypothetical protein O3B47_00605 [bacterium]|nr:hypothetical protein [bacterium]
MNVHKQTLVTVLLVSVLIVGAFVSQMGNTNLFKGQLKASEEKAQIGDNNLVDQFLKPDLTTNIQVMPPENEGGDLSINVTIENLGPGIIDGESQFKYAILLETNPGEFIEIFSNIDSYTFMNPGDSFNFIYPISKPMYQYGNQGRIKGVIDTENNIKEEHEDNNEVIVQFFL